LCNIAGYEVITTSGYSKGFGYRGELSGEGDHAWNGIKIISKWYLVDCTWDASYVDGETYIKEYSTDYIFINSRDNLFSHLPEENNYQFYYP
jgi:transglutaminase/protease-like cytokinesis protein 3